MRTLVVEDDFTNRFILQELLRQFGPVYTALDGVEGVGAVRASLDVGTPFDLICLDIMMPEMDGQAALGAIRQLEDSRGMTGPRARVVMTTALSDRENVMSAFRSQCDGYLVKPVSWTKLFNLLRTLRLVA